MEKYLGVKIIEVEPAWFGYNQIDGSTIYPKSEHPDWTEEQMKAFSNGYKVRYEDGHTSWLPKEVIENEYRRIDSLTFGLAIEAMKQGKKVTRKSWDCNEAYLQLEIDVDRNNGKTILLYFKDGIFVQYSSASCDILAEDWSIIQ